MISLTTPTQASIPNYELPTSTRLTPIGLLTAIIAGFCALFPAIAVPATVVAFGWFFWEMSTEDALRSAYRERYVREHLTGKSVDAIVEGMNSSALTAQTRRFIGSYLTHPRTAGATALSKMEAGDLLRLLPPNEELKDTML